MASLLGDGQPGNACSGWSSLMAEACSINQQQPALDSTTATPVQHDQAHAAPSQQQQLPQREEQQGASHQIQHHHTISSHQQESLGQGVPQQQVFDTQPSVPDPISSFDLAMDLLGPTAAASLQQLPQQMPQQQVWPLHPARSIPPVRYNPQHFVSRLSLKLFNSTPADLPEDLRAQLTGWLKCAPAGAEGYMRPGCVHLTLDSLLTTPGNCRLSLYILFPSAASSSGIRWD